MAMRKCLILSVLISTLFLANSSLGEAKPPIKKPLREMAKQELLTDIKETLEDEEGILGFIPELKKEKDEEGRELHTYRNTRLEDLSKGALEKILVRVRNEALRIRTDRINRQLEAIRKIQRLETNIPKAPSQYTQPQPPRVPTATTPPSRPRIPPPPERR